MRLNSVQRNALLASMIGGALVGVAPATASSGGAIQPIIITDVDMYEWAASSTLRLDTRSGRYSKIWRAGGLPAGVPVPPPEDGVLTGEMLQRIRSIAARTISTWKGGHTHKGGCDELMPVSSVPRLKIVWGRNVLSNGRCWTPEEFEFRRVIEEYFAKDRKRQAAPVQRAL
ncbi:hypothetical protein WBP07_31705 [Novosphingobium sp. BL-8A]|uniref:hypothetical protein n=1 Tax=Novosphingobium sp. BL-8A TaxID=3127639 RepID=UPI0037577933